MKFQSQTSLSVSWVLHKKFGPIPIRDRASRVPWVCYHMVNTFSPCSPHWDLCPSMFQRQTPLMVSGILCRKFQLIPITDWASRPNETQHSVRYHMVNTFSPGSHHWDLCPSNFQRQTSLSVSWVLHKKFGPIPIRDRASRPK